MSAMAGIVAKVAVFLVATLVGGTIALGVTGSLSAKPPATTAEVAPEPDFVMVGDTPAQPVAFDLSSPAPSASPPALIAGLPDADLSLAASSLLGGDPVAPPVKPLGFPRIDPVTQFDGGPFQGSNCTLASGAMLARLGFGIVTTGSILRTLQDDQDGGTGLDDLQTALWRGYGVSIHTGLLRTGQLKALLANGYGAVIQGIYGYIPRQIRLQRSFEGPHAIYVDGYYPGGGGIPEAYYVIDPLGRPHSGYQGEWWPASIVDAFATAFGGGRIPAAWVFPPNGVPPEVTGPDVVPLPPSGDHGPAVTPGPSPSASPSASPSLGPSASPTLGPPPSAEPGDVTPPGPVGPWLDPDVTIADVDLSPILVYCLLQPIPPDCPGGVPGVFEVPLVDIPIVLPGPEVSVTFVDSDAPNVALVGFTVTPSGGPADVRYWEADGSPNTVHGASSISSFTLLGQQMFVARLDVLASTDYRFQAVAGDGLFASVSPVGSFTTGQGVITFEVALSEASSPTFGLGTGFSPYLHLAPGAYAQPLIPLVGSTPAGCTGTAEYGGRPYCLGLADPSVAPATCTRATVTYEVAGIDAEGMLVRAFPTEDGTLPDGTGTLAGVLEADGPAGSGEVSIGCLASGLSYTIVLDAVGDDGGPLAGRVVTVP